MKAIWSGSLGFGLVHIPVKLFGAVENKEIHLEMLDRHDESNIKLQRINANTGKEVAWEDIVKGYKLKDKYVILEDEDLDTVIPEKNKLIEIIQFVDEAEIDSIYYDTPYYLQPDKSGNRPYCLLRDALVQTQKAALGSFVLRNRENLVLIKPMDTFLILNKIRFQEEIRDPKEIEFPSAKVKPAELKLAIHLIEQMSRSFDISNYRDSYNENLLKLIISKAKGHKTPSPVMPIQLTPAVDLMKQLKESLQASN